MAKDDVRAPFGSLRSGLAMVAVGLVTCCGPRASRHEPAASVRGEIPGRGTDQPQAPSPGPTPGPRLVFDEESEWLRQPWAGDLDAMLERRVVRFLVALNPMLYYVDRGRQSGLTYDAARKFEDELNSRRGPDRLPVHVVFIPVPRDELLPALVAGRGDVAAANLTVTEERKKMVDFSLPFSTSVSEIVVSGPAGRPVTSLEDLAGREVFVRASSSYAESLRSLNERLAREDRRAVRITLADERLEAGDILAMVSAGLVPLTVVDSHIAEFWAQVFDGLRLHREVKLRTGASVAWAFRKDSPVLRARVDAFVRANREGTGTGNLLLRRYLRDASYVVNARAPDAMRRFEAINGFLQEYARQYDLDWLLLAAQAYQESHLDQTLRSPAGAVGVMQLLPATAHDPAVAIDDIDTVERNIQAGSKYLRVLIDCHFNDPHIDPFNRMLFALAAYNAGPTRVAGLRGAAARQGLSANVWFDNVEMMAARDIGRETVQYVGNILKYYVAYKRVLEAQADRWRARREAAR